MADNVKRVAYFKMMVPNRAGQGARALAVLHQAGINLIAFSRRLSDLTGQIFSIFVITIAAGEAAIGLALTISLFRQRKTLNVEEAKTLFGPIGAILIEGNTPDNLLLFVRGPEGTLEKTLPLSSGSAARA